MYRSSYSVHVLYLLICFVQKTIALKIVFFKNVCKNNHIYSIAVYYILFFSFSYVNFF